MIDIYHGERYLGAPLMVRPSVIPKRDGLGSRWFFGVLAVLLALFGAGLWIWTWPLYSFGTGALIAVEMSALLAWLSLYQTSLRVLTPSSGLEALVVLALVLSHPTTFSGLPITGPMAPEPAINAPSSLWRLCFVGCGGDAILLLFGGLFRVAWWTARISRKDRSGATSGFFRLVRS
jgi:hypothetical protein